MNKLPIVYPMGAVTVKDEKLEEIWKNESKEWICEHKYDGSRYLIRKEDGKINIVSRQKSRKTGEPVDKTENVPHLVEYFKHLPDGTILDGEIITDLYETSNNVTSIMGSLPERAIKLQEERGYVTYIIFDALYFRGVDLTQNSYHMRRAIIERMYEQFFLDSYKEHYNPEAKDKIQLAKIYTDNFEEIHSQIVQKGGEGTILKNIHKPYVVGKRPANNWVKVKKYDTYDCAIVGYTEPTREYTGKEIETWQYWYHPELQDYVTKQNKDYRELEKQGFIPVTKPFFYDWIGAVRFGQFVKVDENTDYDKEVYAQMEKDGELYRLEEIGQTSGMTEEEREWFSLNQKESLGRVIEVGAMSQDQETFALRHPRFLKMRDDKNMEQCILGEN